MAIAMCHAVGRPFYHSLDSTVYGLTGERVAGGGGFVGLAIASWELGMSAAAAGPDRQTDRACGGVRNGDR